MVYAWCTAIFDAGFELYFCYSICDLDFFVFPSLPQTHPQADMNTQTTCTSSADIYVYTRLPTISHQHTHTHRFTFCLPCTTQSQEWGQRPPHSAAGQYLPDSHCGSSSHGCWGGLGNINTCVYIHTQHGFFCSIAKWLHLMNIVVPQQYTQNTETWFVLQYQEMAM